MAAVSTAVAEGSVPGTLDSQGQRHISGPAGVLVTVLAAALPVITIAVAFTGAFDSVTRRAGHLLFAIPLIFLLYPAYRPRPFLGRGVDLGLALAAAASLAWVIYDRERIMWRLVYVDALSVADAVLGVTAVVVVLEATRRTLGSTLVVLTLAFIAYAFLGPYLPGVLEHKGVTAGLLIEHLYLVPEGVFNQITGIMATYLMVFLTFGTLLRSAGGDRLFMDMAVSMSNRSQGGPAKAAIVASTLMGSVSGSTIANVVTTGTVTIPLMKRCGYRPHEAAAIETAASTGGAVTPPVMGAGVFIMAEFTGIPLGTILLYSLLPALLYFGSLYAYVHVKARKAGMAPLETDGIPGPLTLVARGWHLLVPLGVLVVLLFQNYSPFYASSVCVVALVVLSYVRPETRLTPRRLVSALEESTRGALVLSATSASAAIIMGVISLTGLMLKVTSVVVALAGGSLFVGILLIAMVSTIMGMGLPITSTYIIVSALGASALGELGAPVLVTHLIIFWFAQTATITPPVCMTAFVAAAVAGAPAMRTGFEAMRVGKALYLVPFMFAYSHLLGDSVVRIAFDASAGLLGLMLIPSIVEGFYGGRLTVSGRVMAAAGSAACFISTFSDDLGSTVGWLAVALALVGSLSYLQRRRHATLATAASEGVS